MPDFDMKFKDHEHFDDWINIIYGEEDKYTFQYLHCHLDTLDNGGMLSEFQAELSFS
jgi:hypothetical protein